MRPQTFPIFFALTISSCNCDEGLARLNAAIEVEPEQIDFGKVAVGTQLQRPLTIRNKGDFRLNIEGFSAEAPFIAPVASSSLAVGQSFMVEVGFQPTELGSQTGVLVITSDDKEAPRVEVPLVGEGIQAAVLVDPLTVDFGEVLLNRETVALTRDVTVTNPGTDSFELTAIELPEDGGGDFSMDPMTIVGTFAPGESRSFQVTYLASARGPRTGSVILKTTAPDSAELMVTLLARAVGPGIDICAAKQNETEVCASSGDAPILNFGLVPINGTAEGYLRIQNTGDRDLTLFSYSLAGEAGEFAFAPPPESTSNIVIGPGQDTQINGTYQPADYVFDSVIAIFNTDAPTGSPASAQVRGGVGRPDIDAVPLAITMSLLSGTRQQVTVRLYNCGQEPLTLSQDVTINQTSGPAPAFSLMNAPPAGTTIDPQDCEMTPRPPEGANFTVVFETSTSGFYNAEIPLASNDPVDDPLTVTLEGSKQ